MANVYGAGTYSNFREGRMYRVVIDGKRKSFYGKTDRECHQKYLKFISNIEVQKAIESTDLFGDVIELWWINDKQPYTSKQSLHNYEIYIDKVKNSVLGTTPINKVTDDTINKFFLEPHIAKLKQLTYPKAIIKGTCQYAVEHDYISKNPYVKARLPKEEYKSDSIKIFNKTDANKIISFAMTDEEFGLQILMLMYTGIRRGELCAIHYKDINFVEQFIHIHAAVSKDEFGNYFLNDTTKSKKSRYVPIDAVLCDKLKKASHSKCIWNGKDYYSPSTFENAYERFFTRLNQSLDDNEKVAYLSPHKMRHTFGTYSLKGSHDLRGVQEILGHSRSTTTEIYTHLDIDDKKQVIKNIAY